jgi:hypothetical protein
LAGVKRLLPAASFATDFGRPKRCKSETGKWLKSAQTRAIRHQKNRRPRAGHKGGIIMTFSTGQATLGEHLPNVDTSKWDPALDAVVAAPANHKVLFENENLRVLEVTLAPDEEEPTHHHRWRSVFVLDQVQGPIHDIAPDGTHLPPNRDVIKALQAWDGQGCLVVDMAPQPPGRVLNASGKPLHGIRVEMKAAR